MMTIIFIVLACVVGFGLAIITLIVLACLYAAEDN